MKNEKIIYLFRSNLRILESYHHINTLDNFKKECFDFYLLQGIELLEKGNIDKFIIWRLSPDHPIKDNIFNVGKGQFIQKWVNDFKEIFNSEYQSPMISFFRGGFKEYCELTKKFPDKLGLKLYLSAGKRVYPQYGGSYDKILIEDEKDKNSNYDCIPFYKTTNKEIFYPKNDENKYDICWIANLSQWRMKGQEKFISLISSIPYFKNLKILHIGNEPERGMGYCRKYGVDNIEFAGNVNRHKINNFLNKSKFGLVTSTEQDGCPRVMTEILMTGTPLIVQKETRFLKYYKDIDGVFVYIDKDFQEVLKDALSEYKKIKHSIQINIDTTLSMESICKLNWDMWIKNLQ